MQGRGGEWGLWALQQCQLYLLHSCLGSPPPILPPCLLPPSPHPLLCWTLMCFRPPPLPPSRAERLREDRYNISDEELRPYFALPNVLQGLFKVHISTGSHVLRPA